MAIKSTSALQTDNDNLFTANGNQEITGLLENEFNENHLDSFYNRLDDADLHNFKGIFSTTITYAAGDIVTYFDRLLVCKAAASGVFDDTEWRDYDEFNDTAGLQTVSETPAGTIDLTTAPQYRFLVLNGTGVITISKIIGGVDGRRYRIYVGNGITNLTLTSQVVGTAISNGTGELNNAQWDAAGLIGNAVIQMSDWFEFVYNSDAGKEYNSIVHVQKHLT